MVTLPAVYQRRVPVDRPILQASHSEDMTEITIVDAGGIELLKLAAEVDGGTLKLSGDAGLKNRESIRLELLQKKCLSHFSVQFQGRGTEGAICTEAAAASSYMGRYEEFEESDKWHLVKNAIKNSEPRGMYIVATYDKISDAYAELKKNSNQAKKATVIFACVIGYVDILADWLSFWTFWDRGMSTLAWLCLGSIMAPALLLFLLGLQILLAALTMERAERRSYIREIVLPLFQLALFTAVPIELGRSAWKAVKTIDEGESPTAHIGFGNMRHMLRAGGGLAVLKGLEMGCESLPQTVLQTYGFLLDQGSHTNVGLVFSIASGTLATALTFATMATMKGVGNDKWSTKASSSVTRVLEALFCGMADSVLHVLALALFGFRWGGDNGLKAMGVLGGYKWILTVAYRKWEGKGIWGGKTIKSYWRMEIMLFLPVISLQESLLTLPLDFYNGKGISGKDDGAYLPALVACGTSVAETSVLLSLAYFAPTSWSMVQRDTTGLLAKEIIFPVFAACTLLKVVVFYRMQETEDDKEDPPLRDLHLQELERLMEGMGGDGTTNVDVDASDVGARNKEPGIRPDIEASDVIQNPVTRGRLSSYIGADAHAELEAKREVAAEYRHRTKSRSNVYRVANGEARTAPVVVAARAPHELGNEGKYTV
jgi:hypothetical protein